jgi:hypothetical protein
MGQKYEIPEEFKVVIKKLYKEIEEIEIHEVESIMVYDAMTFNPIERFTIHLKLKLDNYGNHLPLRKKYGDDIKTAFTYTYPDINFIEFSVRSFIDEPKKTNREIMMELFSKK